MSNGAPKRVVVFGSINMDLVFNLGHLPRPSETVLCESYRTVPGGKGANQAVAASKAGGDVTMVGRVGADGFAETVVRTMLDAGVDVSAVREAGAPTGCAAVMVGADGQNQIVVASGANLEAAADDVDDAMLGSDAIVVLQMEVPPDQNWAVVRKAREAGATIVLNVAPAAPVPHEILGLIDHVIVNEIEAGAVAAHMAIDHDSPAEAARAIAGYTRASCIVTLGESGAAVHTREGAWRLGALPIVPVDTTAAGDAFTGAFSAGLAAGEDVLAAAIDAGAAGGIACLGHGAMPSLPDKTAIAARRCEIRVEPMIQPSPAAGTAQR